MKTGDRFKVLTTTMDVAHGLKLNSLVTVQDIPEDPAAPVVVLTEDQQTLSVSREILGKLDRVLEFRTGDRFILPEADQIPAFLRERAQPGSIVTVQQDSDSAGLVEVSTIYGTTFHILADILSAFSKEEQEPLPKQGQE